jgi:hypothetical protein
MFIDLIGIRKGVALHNLNNTVFNLKKNLKILTAIWLKFSSAWLIASKNKIIKNYFAPFRKLYYLESVLYFWLEKWGFGFITNTSRFLSLPTQLIYPSALLYVNYTDNFMKLVEGRRACLLQLGVVDSNSLRNYNNYIINANEKSARSYIFFLNIIFLLALRFMYQNQRVLLF